MTARFGRRALLAAGAAFALGGTFAPWLQARAAAAGPLRLAFIPQENPEKLLDDITVIGEWLANEIGVPVEGFVTLDHAAAIEALRNQSADISFMGALPYVLARDQIGAEVLLSEIYRGKPSYVARIFVRRDDGIEKVADLAGKTIAFADPISESGYLYPLEIVADAGLLEPGADPQSFFGRVYFAGGYQQAIQAVANGLVDAAGVSEFADLLLTPEQQSRIRWIAESRPIPAHAVIARPGLDPALKEKFVAAMLRLNEPENRSLLQHVYGPDGYVRADHEAYEPVAKVARRHGLLG
jgi:phosphonate transport system substrate-binding protein